MKLKSLKRKYEYDIEVWLNSTNKVKVDYPNNTMQIVETIISKNT